MLIGHTLADDGLLHSANDNPVMWPREVATKAFTKRNDKNIQIQEKAV